MKQIDSNGDFDSWGMKLTPHENGYILSYFTGTSTIQSSIHVNFFLSSP
jgi:hypothetical protein